MWNATLALPDELRRRYEELAAQSGLAVEAVLREALEVYAAQFVPEDTRLADAVVLLDRGELLDVEDVHIEDAAILRAGGITSEQISKIDQLIQAEFEKHYGVSL